VLPVVINNRVTVRFVAAVIAATICQAPPPGCTFRWQSSQQAVNEFGVMLLTKKLTVGGGIARHFRDRHPIPFLSPTVSGCQSRSTALLDAP